MALERQTDSPKRLSERIGTLVTGHLFKQIEMWLFDYLLYGAIAIWATSTYGAVNGLYITFAVMTPLSFIVCLIYIWFYDRMKIDWLGLEVMKSQKDAVVALGSIGQIAHMIAKRGDIPAFFALNIFFDPSVATAYLRKGAEQYNGLSKRDWGIFTSSVIFSNAYWTILAVAVVEIGGFIGKWILEFLSQL